MIVYINGKAKQKYSQVLVLNGWPQQRNWPCQTAQNVFIATTKDDRQKQTWVTANMPYKYFKHNMYMSQTDTTWDVHWFICFDNSKHVPNQIMVILQVLYKAFN